MRAVTARGGRDAARITALCERQRAAALCSHARALCAEAEDLRVIATATALHRPDWMVRERPEDEALFRALSAGEND